MLMMCGEKKLHIQKAAMAYLYASLLPTDS